MPRNRKRWIVILSALVIVLTVVTTSAQGGRTNQSPRVKDPQPPDWWPLVVIVVAVLGTVVGLRRMFSRGGGVPADLGDSYSYEDLCLKADSGDPPEHGGKKGDIWVKRIVRVSASPWKLTELRWAADGYEASASAELVRDVSELIHQQRRRKHITLNDETLCELDYFAEALGNLIASGHTWSLALDAEIEQIKVIVTFIVYYCTAPEQWREILKKDFPFKPNYTHIVPVRSIDKTYQSLVKETVRVIDDLIKECARWPLQAR